MGAFQIEITLIVFLSIASLVAVGARRIRLPYTIVLVLTGLLVGVTNFIPAAIPHIPFTSDLILITFLPALLFEAAFHTEFDELRQNIRIISALAIPGVLASMFIVATLVHLGIGLAWPIALLFGSLISATDPISVMAIFRDLRIARRLSIIAEGESLFNDGTAIVLFRLMLGIILAGDFDPLHGLGQFIVVAFGGALAGFLIGYIFSQLIRPIDDYLVEITITMVLAYGTFFLAESLHISGVIAVVAAGLVMGNYGARKGMSPTTRLAVVSFWEYAAFVANSFIFLLIGLQSDLLPLLWHSLFLILGAILAVLVARAIVVYGLTALICRFICSLPLAWQHVLVWGGLRGSISLALALSLPETMAERQFILVMAFGVVLFSLLVQGLTTRPLLEHLNLARRAEEHLHYERVRGELLALRSAWEMLRELNEDGVISPSVWQTLDYEYRLAGQRLSAELETLYRDHGHLQVEELLTIRRESLRTQRAALIDLERRGIISLEVYEQLVKKVDAQLEELNVIEVPPTPQPEPAQVADAS
jgi:CPA1 family monovalent cation:H+ antiporter